MLIVIAPEHDRPNEIDIVIQLFNKGLMCFHLRKPHYDFKEYQNYLNQIDAKFHHRIVVHRYHELIHDFDLKGIHFQEHTRKDCLSHNSGYNNCNGLNINHTKTVSSSFHEIENLKQCDFEFDYHLLSPVFNSISKEGYEGRVFDVKEIDKYIVGMGGVTPKNLSKLKALGYQGVAALGCIWQSKQPVEAFKNLQTTYTSVFST